MKKGLWASTAKAAGTIEVDTSLRARIEAGGVARLGACLPRRHKALGSISSSS